MKLLVVGDYSQLEPRLMAHSSGDERLIETYMPGGSGDVYVDMARGVFGEQDVSKEHRDICKTLMLGMSYGAGDRKVGMILTINGYPTSVEVGAEYVAKLRTTYPHFFKWRDEVIQEAHLRGYVCTLSGHRRRLAMNFRERQNYKLVGYGERQAVNAIIQGSAADIVRRVMVRSAPLFPEMKLLAQVHDELVWEVDMAPSVHRLDELAAFGATGHGFDLRVPLVFEPHVGDSWYAGKEGSSETDLDYEEFEDALQLPSSAAA